MNLEVLLMNVMSKVELGCVFTPSKWAGFAIEEYRIFQAWMDGARVIDPTMGNGNLLAALVEYGLKKGYSVSQLPVHQLYGIELNNSHYTSALLRLQGLCGSQIRLSNFQNMDVLDFQTNDKFDIAFGNPPWLGFSALPEEYRKSLREKFISSGLALSGNKLLLGNAQINIAALIFFHVMVNMIREKGSLYMFMPMSVLFHAGAHGVFGSGRAGEMDFALKSIINLSDTDAFQNVSTRYGIIHVQRDSKMEYPVDLMQFDKISNSWTQLKAAPLFGLNGPLHVYDKQKGMCSLPKIDVSLLSKPRQGINTCGANSVYFFHRMQVVEKGKCRVWSEYGEFELPTAFVFPLLRKENFRQSNKSEGKWVLLPYNKDGKALLPNEMEKIPMLLAYFQKHKHILEARRGKLIGNYTKRGMYWALLGVGKYNFAKHKIVWEACGKNDFKPTVFTGKWQAGQSLQVYMPFDDMAECKRVFKLLRQPAMSQCLKSMQLDGTMSFGQPGVISHFLNFSD